MNHRVVVDQCCRSLPLRTLAVGAALSVVLSAAPPVAIGAAAGHDVSEIAVMGDAGTRSRQPIVRGIADCDSTTGEWVVRWHITNPYAAPAAITLVAVTPEGTKAYDVPSAVKAESTVATGEHRLPPGMTSASIELGLIWTDDVEGRARWPVYIRSWCAAVK